MNLDTTFMAQVITIIGFAIGLSLLLASMRYLDHIRRSLRAYAIGKFMVGTAFLIGAFRGDVMPVLMVALANGLGVAGVTMNLLSVRHLQNKPAWPHWPAILGLAVALGCAVAVAAGPNLSLVRLMSSVAVIGVLTVVSIEMLFRFDGRGVAHYATGLLTLLVVGAYIARLGAALAHSGNVSDQMADDDVERIAFTLTFLGTVIGAINFVLMASDEFNKELTTLAHTDGLTGTLNRRRFFELGEVEFRRARRHDHDLTVLTIDIDRFKVVNDHAGHPFGDRVIQAVADCCIGQLRAGDNLGRLGGEEFALLLPDAGTGVAERLAERLRAAIEREVGALGAERGVAVTCSIGGVSLRPDHADFSDLIAQSDSALYEAKNGGRNQVRFAVDGSARTSLAV